MEREFIKDSAYYGHTRNALVDMLPDLKGRFLDIGCGSGGTIEYLKKGGVEYVAGIDMSEESVREAEKRGADSAIVADIEKDELPYPPFSFDCIIMADVLEHLFDPWRALSRCVELLNEDGCLLLSLPNVRHYSVLRRLIFHDEWSYEDAGILDITHIRFFTLKEILALLRGSGLKVNDMKRVFVSSGRLRRLNMLLGGRLDAFFTYQYYILAVRQ